MELKKTMETLMNKNKDVFIKDYLLKELSCLEENGLYKKENIIKSRQNAHILVDGTHPGEQKELVNMCSNNYLGLAGDEEIIQIAKKSLDERGFGMASVRFICGTQDIHKQLENRISQFYETEDTILYPSCFDANGGLFETLLTQEDAVISDELNHASIIDGIRLCKAARYRYKNNDMQDLELKLQQAQSARFRLIATDGVFSMDGYITNLKDICDLADKYDALVMVDECHATGILGARGRGTAEHWNVTGRVDIYTGTLGKALGGASGGYTTGKKEIIAFLRQRSRPYLFSNAIAPHIVAASIAIFDKLICSNELKDKLAQNTHFFRKELQEARLPILSGEHPIVPVMTGEASLAQKIATRMFEKGVYVVGFFYPVVPKGKARIRTQVSAAHTFEDLAFVVEKLKEVKKEFNL